MSVPGMNENDDKHPRGLPKRSFVPERRNRKPWKASDVKARAEKSVADEGLGWEIHEGK